MHITQLIKNDPDIELLSVLVDAVDGLTMRNIYERAKSLEDITSTGVHLHNLIEAGLLRSLGEASRKLYFITDAGREKLALHLRGPAIPVFIQEQPQPLESELEAEPIKENPKERTPQAVVATLENNSLQLPKVTASEWEPSTTAFLMLKAMQHYPDSTMSEISALVDNKDAHEKYIPSYIKSGFVITSLNQQNRKTYRLKEGMTALDVYDWRGRRRQKAYAGLVKKVEQSGMVQVQAPKQFRVAYTSDHSLILTGLTDQPIEISPQNTQTLFEFISDSIMPVAVFEQ